MKRPFCFTLCILLVVISNFSFGQNWLWAKGSIGSNWDAGYSVSADVIGNVFVTGYFGSSTIAFGSTTLTNTNNNGSDDIFVAKYDANGNVLWAKSAGGTSSDWSFSVSADPSGNVFVAGCFKSPSITFGSTTLTNADPSGTTPDVFIAKYDASGNVLWAKSAGGTGDDRGSSVSVDAAGNVYATGTFSSMPIIFGSTSLVNADPSGNSNDIFITKYDGINGNVLWAQRAGGMGDDRGIALTADVGGNVFLTGWFSDSVPFGSTTLFSAGGTDVFIAKYNCNNGNVIWAKSAIGANGDIGSSVSADAVGNVFVTGYFYSPSLTFGTITLVNAGIADLFIAKYDSNGNVLWAQRAGGTGCCDEGHSVSADVSGNVFLTGTFGSPTITFGSYIFPFPAGAVHPMFIVKYDSNGNVICASVLAGGANSSYGVVSADHFGNAYVAGGYEINPFIVGTDTLLRTGQENVFVAKYFCCSNSFPVTVSGTNTIYQGQTTTLTASGGVNYLWNTSETTTAISVTPTVTTIYCVTVSDSNNCIDSACARVYVESPCDTAGIFFFPNAFSPNNDGDNDYLKIYYREMNCIATLHLIIYDRWGEQVFETTDKNFAWDGSYPKQMLNTQVLAYHLTVGFTDGKAINRKGNISLVR